MFERLWAEAGCRAVIEELALKRKHDFALERAILLTVLHRLMGGGADLAADGRRADYRIAGVEALELHHLYRAMAWLGEELPAREQDDHTPFAPRCTKDLIAVVRSSVRSLQPARSCDCWTLPVSILKAPAGTRLAATATARIIGRTCRR